MKYRKGFVTNSSSTSYTIAIKKENETLPKEIEQLLLEWAKSELLNSSDTISNIEELNSYFIDKYSYRKDITLEEILKNKDEKEEYKKLKEKIENGFTIYTKYISCEGQDEHLEMYENALDLLKKSKYFEDIKTDLYY